jgi:hypothetical protein
MSSRSLARAEAHRTSHRPVCCTLSPSRSGSRARGGTRAQSGDVAHARGHRARGGADGIAVDGGVRDRIESGTYVLSGVEVAVGLARVAVHVEHTVSDRTGAAVGGDRLRHVGALPRGPDPGPTLVWHLRRRGGDS